MSTHPASRYPVGYEVDFAERRNRATAFFRILLAIPLMILMVGYGIAVGVTIVVAWFALLATARYPDGLYRFNAAVVRWVARANAYVWLATDAYAPLDLGTHPEHAVRVPVAPPKAAYSRPKVLFRVILGIPVMLINYALTMVLQVAGLLSWCWIVATGRQHAGLQSALNLGLAYNTRHNAYLALLTEDWPPFSADGTDPLGPGPSSGGLPPGPETAEKVETPAVRPPEPV